MLVAYRADASNRIGTGHVRRGLALADALRAKGVEVVFVSRRHEGDLIGLIAARGYRVLPLPPRAAGAAADDSLPHAAWLGVPWQVDATETIEALSQAQVNAEWMLVDHYGIDARWERTVRDQGAQIFVIDDLADRAHDCTLLLDQNIVAGMAARYDPWLPPTCGRLIGPRFALLQPEFARLHPLARVRSGPVRRILVFVSGADHGDVTSSIVQALEPVGRAGVAVDVVAAAGSPLATSMTDPSSPFRLHVDVPTLAPLMADADLAIGAGGVTTWERLCLGLPALVVTVAANQEAIAEELDRRGLVRWLGRSAEVTPERIRQAVAALLDTGLDPEWSGRCHATVDGNGAARVAAALTVDGTSQLVARRATVEDEDVVLEWANDPLTRANGFAPGAIARDTHHRWFSSRLSSPTTRFFIVECAEGVPLGQVRFEREGGSWVVNYGLGPAFRGRGLGRPLLECGLETLEREAGGGIVTGQVKQDNVASCRIFSALGFDSRPSSPGVLLFERSW